MYIDFLLVMEHPFDDTEISKFADKLKYIPQWYTDFFGKIHKRDKSSDYYRGCYATLRFLPKDNFPPLVECPSANISPFLIFWPNSTIGL